jgi:hypothetical protein
MARSLLHRLLPYCTLGNWWVFRTPASLLRKSETALGVMLPLSLGSWKVGRLAGIVANRMPKEASASFMAFFAAFAVRTAVCRRSRKLATDAFSCRFTASSFDATPCGRTWLVSLVCFFVSFFRKRWTLIPAAW